ncbi:MAG: hypothetical protein ABW134_11935 [Candidatus Thiodiazotropha endolucinida]
MTLRQIFMDGLEDAKTAFNKGDYVEASDVLLRIHEQLREPSNRKDQGLPEESPEVPEVPEVFRRQAG